MVKQGRQIKNVSKNNLISKTVNLSYSKYLEFSLLKNI